jgi:hypothetical protein
MSAILYEHEEQPVVTFEITTKTTKGRHRSSPCRRIGKDSAGMLCGVHRCFAVLCDYRSRGWRIVISPATGHIKLHPVAGLARVALVVADFKDIRDG